MGAGGAEGRSPTTKPPLGGYGGAKSERANSEATNLFPPPSGGYPNTSSAGLRVGGDKSPNRFIDSCPGGRARTMPPVKGSKSLFTLDGGHGLCHRARATVCGGVA